jgi:hypothetical protein
MNSEGSFNYQQELRIKRSNDYGMLKTDSTAAPVFQEYNISGNGNR